MGTQETFRDYIGCLNQHDWAGAGVYLSDELLFNGRRLSKHNYLSELEGDQGEAGGVESTIDILLCDDSAGSLAARVIVKPTGDAGKGSSTFSTHSKHVFCWFERSKISEIREIIDVDAIESHQSEAVKAPTWSGEPCAQPIDLKGFYRDYIGCINAQTMASNLGRFCHPVVTHNGKRLSIEKYKSLMETSQEAISGLTFNIHTTIANDETQQLAARIEFTGTPALEWAGAKPNGGPVEFSEHVFYWLDDGKISEVVSLVDLKTYREQLSKSAS